MGDRVGAHGLAAKVAGAILATWVALALACGGGDSGPDKQPPPADAGIDADAEAGPVGRAAPETSLDDGGCRDPGVPKENCAQGFEADDAGGCEPVMPDSPCPKGLIAVPGDAQCREIMPCGNGPWGDIPVEANTQFVDASFTGTSDGSQASPWKTIGDAVANAGSGALIAVAEGTYEEDVVIFDQPARLWGRCPAKVTIVGSSVNSMGAGIEVVGSSGTEVHGFAITGNAIGLYADSSTDTLVDRVWVHDTGYEGISVQTNPGDPTTTLRITGSLVESAANAAVFVASANVTVEATSIRDTQASVAVGSGYGVAAQQNPGVETSAVVEVRGSALERNQAIAVQVAQGARATVEGSLVRDTILGQNNINPGAIAMEASARGDRPSLTVRKSLFDGNCIVAEGADLVVEDTVVRHTRGTDRTGGVGIDLSTAGTEHTKATVTRSVVDDAQSRGIQSIGADLTITGCIVRNTIPDPANMNGEGLIFIADDPFSRRTVTVRSSLFERNQNAGVIGAGVDFTFDHSEVSHTLQQEPDGLFGDGLIMVDQTVDALVITGSAVITSSAFRDNFEEGIGVECKTATLDQVIVSGTKPNGVDGALGDGISIVGNAAHPTSATITGAALSDNHRAGIANFGGTAIVGGSTLSCNGFDLDAEPNADNQPAVYQDQGGNVCTCGGKSAACTALSANLEPPTLPM